MNTDMIETILGITYNACFISCYWPQIIKSIRTKSVEDVSIHLFTLSIVGYTSAIFYTLLRVGFDFFWLFNYVVSGISAIIMTIVYFMYREKSV